MNTRIYFNPLPASVTEGELMDLFSSYGNIVSVHIATDRTGIVTMITPEGARAAIQSLNGRIFASGTLALSETPPKGDPAGAMNNPSGPRRGPSHLY